MKSRMGILDRISAFLYGSGDIEFEFTLDDGRTGYAHTSYVGPLADGGLEEAKGYVRDSIRMQTGRRVKELTITKIT